MRKIYLYLVIILLLLIPVAQGAVVNWSINTSTDYTVDLVNSTYLYPFMYYLMVSNNTPVWELPVIGIFIGITGPFTDAFNGFGGGSTIYIILWGLFLLMVWKNSGRVTIPALICAVTAGAWSLLIPESSQPWVTILLAASIAALVLNFFTTGD